MGKFINLIVDLSISMIYSSIIIPIILENNDYNTNCSIIRMIMDNIIIKISIIYIYIFIFILDRIIMDNIRL
jgi:hypothetical protein